MKHLFFIGLLSYSLLSHGQNKCNYINFILFVDNKVEQINGGILVVDSLTKEVTDTILFKNNIGTLTFSDLDYLKLKKVSSTQNVIIQFRYSTTIPSNPKYDVIYNDTLAAKWFTHGYMIMNIYNFQNRKNWNEFDEREGYGIEWQASERFKIIPRSKKWIRKHKKVAE